MTGSQRGSQNLKHSNNATLKYCPVGLWAILHAYRRSKFVIFMANQIAVFLSLVTAVFYQV